jgi:hypothetical protein
MKEQRNTWTEVDGVKLSMYTGEKLSDSDRAYWGYKREYGFGLMNVGTPCNTKCFYCSQYWNPPDLLVTYGSWLTMDQIKHFLKFVPDKLIHAIGYGHHVNNGEFFAHPKSLEILEYLRDNNYKVKGFDTNGHDISENHIKILKGFQVADWDSFRQTNAMFGGTVWSGIYLHLTNWERTEPTFKLFNEYDIPYQVTIVPSRKEIKMGRMETWISNLQKYKPVDIEISMPAYTKYTPDNIAYLMDLSFDEMWPIIDGWREKYPDINITSESTVSIEHIKNSLDWLESTYAGTKAKPLFLTSEAVEGVFETELRKLKLEGFDDCRAVTTKNNTFGGNIKVGGLLLVEDYDIAIEETLTGGYKPDLIVMPKTSYCFDDLDLRGISAHSLEKKYGIEVIWC